MENVKAIDYLMLLIQLLTNVFTNTSGIDFDKEYADYNFHPS